MQPQSIRHRRTFIALLVALAGGFLTAASHAGDTYKWTVQYLIDNSQQVFGRSQKVWPRRNRGIALSPDGKYLYLGYIHGANGGGEVRKVAVGVTDDFTKSTIRSLQGPTGKAIVCDDKGRVYIANEGEILIFDSNLHTQQQSIPVGMSEGLAVVREGGELVLYSSDRQFGALQRFVLEEKDAEIVSAKPAGFDGSGQLEIPHSSSLRGLEVDPKGNIWIADNEAGRVFRVSKDGKQIDSAEVQNATDVGFDGGRAFVTRGKDRVIAVLETDSMKLLGNLSVPWEELELTPTGNNRNGALSGIAVVPGKGFFVTNETGQTANQKSPYGKADENTDFVAGKLYRDAYLDDNDPVLRALEVQQ
jgi:DNA-binding beta-propeller fold protein YncE